MISNIHMWCMVMAHDTHVTILRPHAFFTYFKVIKSLHYSHKSLYTWVKAKMHCMNIIIRDTILIVVL